MTPAEGDWVQMLPLRGVAAPRMHARIGQAGYVLRVRHTPRGIELQVRFPDRTAAGGGDTYWLGPGEFAPVAVADGARR